MSSGCINIIQCFSFKYGAIMSWVTVFLILFLIYLITRDSEKVKG